MPLALPSASPARPAAMRRIMRVCRLVVITLALAAGAAWATVISDPVSVRLTGPRPVAEAGATLRVAFELRAPKTAVVENLRVEGEGWTGRLVAGSRGFAVTAAAPVRVQFECSTSRPSSPLVVACEVAGKTWRQSFDLSPEGAAARRGRAVRSVEAALPGRPSLPTGLAAPVMAPPVELAGEEARDARAAARYVPDPAAPARVVTVRGSFVYRRPDGAQVGADGLTVVIYDWNSGIPTLLGIAVTDAWGRFEYPVNWSSTSDPNPDIFLWFEAANGWVSVCPEGDDDGYSWITSPQMDVTGSVLDFGGITSADETLFPALHVFTDLVRDRRWYEASGILTMPYVRTRWPVSDGSVSHYHAASGEIHVVPSNQWDEIVHGHEYGHAFFHMLGIWVPAMYCLEPNYCDANPPDDCGHCTWCPEEPFSQWGEAGPTWLAVVQCEAYGPLYGLPASSGFQCESLQQCEDTGYLHHPRAFGDPLTTEGFALALLYDIYDAANEPDTAAAANGADELTVAPVLVLDAIVRGLPLVLSQFINSFISLHPELHEPLWATAMNNRLDYDANAPGVVTDLHSTSHTIGVLSPDDTPTFAWNRAPDDWSGADGYCMTLTHAPDSPGFSKNVPDTTTYTVAPLEPGEWYVNLRAVDRAGHWSTDWQSAGPYRIRERTLADLRPWTPVGWSAPLVPRPLPDALTDHVPYPAAPLPGNQDSTWWNAGCWNSGETDVPAGTWNRLYLDGEPVGSQYPGYIAGGMHLSTLNRGPLTVSGGRHTLAMVMDADEGELESNESNNVVGRQWIWQPRVMSLALHHRAAPPHPQGGYSQVTYGGNFYSNCDGLRLDLATSAANWQLAFVRPDSANGNLITRLFTATTSPTSGFDVPLATSNRGAGRLNAVLVHRRNAGSTMLWDVGVLRDNSVLSGYLSRKVTSTSLALGDSLRHTFSGGQDMRLFDFAPAAGATGWHTVRIRKVSGPGTVHAAWFDDGFVAGSLADRDEYEAVSDTSEIGFLDVNVTDTGGGYGIAVWHDMKDGEDPVEVEIELERTQPDFEPWLSDLFYSPLVPSPAATSPPDTVPAPSSLPGNSASTYLNMVVRNNSNGPDPTGPYASVDVDGGLAFWVKVAPLTPHVIYPFRIQQPVTVRGGRHTLTVEWDRPDAIGERDETNNVFGEQWVWSPLALHLAAPLTRSAPPERTGGWDQLTSAPFGLFYDCDGLRTPRPTPLGHDSYWLGMAVMPGDTSDVDVRLHETAAGTQEGFRANLRWSAWGVGQLDFCLANFNQTLPRAFDVGVLRGSGTQPYSLEAVVSRFLGDTPNGAYGPYTLGSGHLLALHEVYLGARRWQVMLEPRAGSVDWGLSVHPGSAAYLNKSHVVGDAIAWLAGPGASEAVTFEAPTEGYFCIAVWKAGPDDVPLAGEYRLHVDTSLLDAPDGSVPARTALRAAYPNPSGGTSRIGFDLAHGARVTAEVYDLRGARVRSLCDRSLPAGRHELVWEGDDNRGRSVAPGVYLVRFRADGVEGVRRVVRLD